MKNNFIVAVFSFLLCVIYKYSSICSTHQEKFIMEDAVIKLFLFDKQYIPVNLSTVCNGIHT